MPAPPPPSSRTGLLVGVIILLAVALVAATGTAVYLAIGRQRHTPAVTATAAPRYGVTVQYPLTSSATGWPANSYGFLSEGSFHIKDRYYCLAPLRAVANGKVSVQIRQVAGSIHRYYGLIFRLASPGNAYGFEITSDGYWAFERFVKNQASVITRPFGTRASQEGLDVSNTLDVRIKGANCIFPINGQMVGQATDTTYSTGYSGVLGTTNGEVAFNNFTVSFGE